MSGRYLLDTNIIISLFADEPLVKSSLGHADAVFVPSVALGELYYGARKSSRIQANLARIDDFIANSTVLVSDAETAKQYGIIKNKLRQKGRPLPENDIWIAALALQYNLVLLTRDAHFQQIEMLDTSTI